MEPVALDLTCTLLYLTKLRIVQLGTRFETARAFETLLVSVSREFYTIDLV